MNTTGQARGVFPLNSIIRTAVVFLTAIGLALTVQTGASAAGARDAALPDAIVNGDFEYLGESLLAEADDTRNFANVDYEHAQASTFSSMGGAWFVRFQPLPLRVRDQELQLMAHRVRAMGGGAAPRRRPDGHHRRHVMQVRIDRRAHHMAQRLRCKLVCFGLQDTLAGVRSKSYAFLAAWFVFPSRV